MSVLLVDGGGKETQVPLGETVLGRGDFLGIQDKRLSRNQAMMEVEADGSTYITVQGVNPTYMTKKGGKVKMLKKGKKYQLGHGDFFTLLTNQYPFTVKIKGDSNKQKPAKSMPVSDNDEEQIPKKQQEKPKQEDKPKPKQQEEKPKDEEKPKPKQQEEKAKPKEEDKPKPQNENASKKRKIEDDSDDGWGEGSGDEMAQKVNNAKIGGKFAKYGSSNAIDQDDSKPACPYGAGCYRKNPAHLSEYSHPQPGDKKQKTDSGQSSKPIPKSSSPPDELVLTYDDNKLDMPSSSQKNSQSSQGSSSQNSQKSGPPALKKNVNFDDKAKAEKAKPKTPTGEWSIAFPVISASAYCKFDVQKAVAVASEAIKAFVESNPTFKVKFYVVVEPEKLKDMIRLFQKNDAPDGIVEVTDKPILETGAKVIAIETGWRFKQEPRNKAVYSASECLLEETKKRYPDTTKYGSTYPVPLPPSTPLPNRGIEWVIHCAGPNMNPEKPDCLNSYNESSPVLKKTFESLFDNLFQIACGTLS